MSGNKLVVLLLAINLVLAGAVIVLAFQVSSLNNEVASLKNEIASQNNKLNSMFNYVKVEINSSGTWSGMIRFNGNPVLSYVSYTSVYNGSVSRDIVWIGISRISIQVIAGNMTSANVSIYLVARNGTVFASTQSPNAHITWLGHAEPDGTLMTDSFS